MKSSILATIAISAASVSAAGNYAVGNYSMSTVYTTSVYTVTSCAPEVTDCPARMGSVTTDVISLYTTLCPVTATETPTMTASAYPVETAYPMETPYTTSTVYTTKEYTILSCPPEVTNCPIGSKTSSVETYTTYCPVQTTVVASMSTGPASPPPSRPTGTTVAPPPTKPSVTLSVITYSTCVPTTYVSVITVYPSASASATPSVGAVCPGGKNCPATTVVAMSYGTAVPTYAIYPVKNNTQTYVPVTGAGVAKQAGGVLAAVGVAVAIML